MSAWVKFVNRIIPEDELNEQIGFIINSNVYISWVSDMVLNEWKWVSAEGYLRPNLFGDNVEYFIFDFRGVSEYTEIRFADM